MALSGNHQKGDSGHLADHNSIDTSLSSHDVTLTAHSASIASMLATLNTQVGGTTTVYDGFAGKGTKALTNADSGHVWGLVSSISGAKQSAGAASGISIVSGLATNTIATATPAAGYAATNAGASLTRMGADISFSTFSTLGGAAALVAFAQDISATFPTIPDTDVHVTIAPTGWTWGVFRNNVFTQIGLGDWKPGFTWGANTVRRVGIAIGSGVGYIAGPDGVTYTVTDSRIGQTNMQYATFEVFQGTAASTDARASFQNVSYDTHAVGLNQSAPTYLEIERRLAGSQSLIIPQAAALSYGPSATTITLPASQTIVDATNLSLPFRVPASGNIMVELEGWIQWLAAPQNFLWSIWVPEMSQFLQATQLEATGAQAQARRYHVSIPILGLGSTLIGTVIRLQWAHFSLAANNAQLVLNGAAGQPAVMKVTALA